VYSGLFAAAAAVGFWLTRPLEGGPAGPDAAAYVLFFDRIAAGRHLETWVNTTPKPLLTVVLGGLHAVSGGDWRPGAVASVVVAALGIVLGAELARRVAGPVAGCFAFVALIGLGALQAETSWSYGLPWVLPLWMIAGLALIRREPRYGVAGIAFLVAGLIRPETFILLGVATAGLIGQVLRGDRLPARAWLLGLGWLAVIGLCLHDALLTGDPWWWTSVARRSVALNGGAYRSVGGVLSLSARLVVSMLPLAIAAAVGGLILLRRGSWAAAAGLIALGPLVFVYTWVLALSGVNVLSHYLHPAAVAIVLAASVGVGFVVMEARDRVAIRLPATGRSASLAVACAVGIVVAIVLSRPFVPLNAGARQSVGLEARIATRLAAAEVVIDRALPSHLADVAIDPGPTGQADPAGFRLLVPAHRTTRLAIDLGLPMTRVGGVGFASIDLAHGRPSVGSIVYLDKQVEAGSVGPETIPLQVTQPTTIGGVRVVPIVADPGAGMWIVRIDPAP
jgi:hypothetical protein